MHEPENTLMCEQPFQGNGYYPASYPKRRIAPTGGRQWRWWGASQLHRLNATSLGRGSKNQIYVLLSHCGGVLRKERLFISSCPQSKAKFSLTVSNPVIHLFLRLVLGSTRISCKLLGTGSETAGKALWVDVNRLRTQKELNYEEYASKAGVCGTDPFQRAG